MASDRGANRSIAQHTTELTAVAALAGTLAGGACHLAGAPAAGDWLWRVTLVATIVPLTWSVARALLRGDFGVDVIALLAMVGALVGGELLAGAIVAVMLAGGNALEAYADGRARRELTALLRRAPQIAHRRDGEEWDEVEIGAVASGRRAAGARRRAGAGRRPAAERARDGRRLRAHRRVAAGRLRTRGHAAQRHRQRR